MGTGASSWLWPDEQIVYWARQSAGDVFWTALIIAVAAGGTGLAFDFFRDERSLGSLIIGALIAGFSVGLPHFLVAFRRFELVLTSHRLFYRRGLVLRKSGEIAVADIREIKGEDEDGDHPFDLELSGGKSLTISNLPDLGRLRETLERAAGLS